MTNRASLSDSAFARRVFITVLIIALTLAAWRLSQLLLLVFGAILIAVLLRTLATALCRLTGIPARWALPVVFFALAALLGAASWLFGAQVSAQGTTLFEILPEAWRSFEQLIGSTFLGERLLQWLREVTPEGSGILTRIGQFIVSLGSGVIDFVLVLVGGVYLAFQPGLYRTGLLKLIAPEHRSLAAETLEDTAQALRLWLMGQLAAMIAIGSLTGLGLALIGVPSALALGLLAGLAEFVPLIGPVVAAIPALLIALTQGADTALWTLGLYVFLQQLEGNIVTPLVQQRAVTLPPALTLFSLVAAAILFGPLGVLLATPLTVVAFVIIKRLYVREVLDTPTPVPGEKTQETQPHRRRSGSSTPHQ